MHSWDYADSEYVKLRIICGVDVRVQSLSIINALIYSLSHRHTQASYINTDKETAQCFNMAYFATTK